MSKHPLGWKAAKIGELISQAGEFTDGDWVESKDQDPNGAVRLIQLADIGDGYFRDRSDRFLTRQKAEELNCTFLEHGDVLVARMPDPLGRACIFPGFSRECVTVVDVAILRPGTDLIENRWLMRFLNATQIRDVIEELSSGTTRKRISRKNLADIQIPVPPINEQKRIADKLDQTLAIVERAKARLARVPETLKQFRQSVLAAATDGRLTEDLRPNGRESQANGLPKDWTLCQVKDAGKIQLGRQRSPKFHSGENMRPYLRVQNVFEDRIDLSDVMQMAFPGYDVERYQLHPGDILLNEGQSPEYLGRPAMYRGELPGACFTNTLIRFQAYDHVKPDFALLVFRNHMHSGRYSKEGTITTNIAHLGAGRFGTVEFPVPPLDEQLEIVRRVETLFALADRIEARYQAISERVDKLTQSLLAKAFRGELVPQDPNDEPASVLLERIRAQRAAEPAPKCARRNGAQEPA